MNKNVSVWRGPEAPPTNYHVWINEKKNNAIYLHNGSDWDPVIDPDAYETLLDYLRHKEDSPKIDVINEIPNGNDFKNGEFQLYKLGKDITISSPECYEFGKTASFTIREGDLCLIGKIKHTPTSLETERPKFSDKYKYKIRFDANLDYYFGGTGNVGDPVLTTTTQPLTYSLIGSEDKFIIKCGNYYAFISGERLSLTNQLSNATHFVLHELESNKFELLNYNSQSLGLNAHQGLGTDGDYSDEIHWYDAGRPGNIVQFLPQESELIIRKIISTQEATTSYSGLMSKEDKAKLNSIASNANNYSLPTASSLTKGGIRIGYSQTANNRAVQLSSNKAYVNIPDATTSQAGLMSSSDKSKLDGIANTYKPKQTAVTSPTTSGSAIDFIDSISQNANGVVTATKKSVRNATISQSGLMSSSDKNKLDNSSAYKHVFTGLSALASSGDGWYHIIDLGDTEAAIVQISTGGHSDVQLAISSGWGGDDSYSLNILNSLLRGNPNYAYVKAVRIRKHKNGDSGYLRLEAKLNRTDYTDAKYRTTVVSVLTNANHNPIVTSDTTDKKHLLQLVTTTSETLLQEINLVDQAMIVKNIVADNLATVATSGNYNDLKNKPSTASTTTNGLMSASDKQKIDAELDIHKINEPTEFDFNMYTEQGVYNFHCMSDAVNSPVNSRGEIKGRLTVLSVSSGDSVITQVVNLNNADGGEGNVYIRSCQKGTWKPWSKLQTNVEVGLVTLAALDNDPFLDNGIFSGICGDTGETFVLICINNYAIAPQNKSIAQLKYSLFIGSQDGLTPGEVKIEKRSRNTTGFWTEWENIGGGSILPEATTETIGGVKLGKNTDSQFIPLVNISNNGTGVGIKLDSGCFTNESGSLKLNYNSTLIQNFNGIGVALGTTPPVANGSNGLIIPCVMGTGQSVDDTKWNSPSVGILYNEEQFCLKYNGLNLKDGIGSGVTKVTWDANSNMNDFKTPGVYEIYGERTMKTDNLPIMNEGSGHSISARLTVVASTLQPANNEICVTQFLQLSNRVGGDGNMYVRTYNQNNGGVSSAWSPWQKQMGMVETLINSNDTTVGQEVFSGAAQKIGDGLNSMIDNGMYSGIYIDNLTYTGASSLYYLSAQPTFVETFVLVVINDYAASGKLNLPRHITQLKYAVDAITGQSTVKKRVGTGNDTISWGDWTDIGGGSQEVDITDAVMAYGLPELIRQGSVKENVIYKIKAPANEIVSNTIFTLDNNDVLSKHIKNIFGQPAFDDKSSLVSIEFDYKIIKAGELGYSEYIINGTVTMYNTSFKFCIHCVGYEEVVDIFKSDVINTYTYTNDTETIKLFPDIVHMVSSKTYAVIDGAHLSREAYTSQKYSQYKIFVQKGGNLALGTDVTNYTVHWENDVVPDYTNNSVLVTFENFGEGPYYYAHFKNF